MGLYHFLALAKKTLTAGSGGDVSVLQSLAHLWITRDSGLATSRTLDWADPPLHIAPLDAYTIYCTIPLVLPSDAGDSESRAVSRQTARTWTNHCMGGARMPGRPCRRSCLSRCRGFARLSWATFTASSTLPAQSTSWW